MCEIYSGITHTKVDAAALREDGCVATFVRGSASGLKDTQMTTRPTIFKWRQTEPQLILCAVRWYLRYSLSVRDIEELLEERCLGRAFESLGSGGFLNRLLLRLWPEARIPAPKRVFPFFLEHTRPNL
jgi:hypothetical protein